MGLSLTLAWGVSLWRTHKQDDPHPLLYNRLRIGSAKDLQGPIESMANPRPLPEGVMVDVYGDEGLETTSEDPYGHRLTWTTCGELAKVDVSHRHSSVQAVWAMLAAFDPDLRVYLYWT